MPEPESNGNLNSPERSRSENSVRPSKKLRKEGIAQDAAPQAPHGKSAAKPARSVPEDVRRRFVQIKNQYYFPDGARAFTDRGTRLTSDSENTEVIRSLVQIAEARGWSEITVRGTERFRKEAWAAAQKMGIEVRGYQPTEFERARLVRTVSRQAPGPVQDSISEGARPVPPERQEVRVREKRDGPITGKLVDHGRATYQQDPHAPMSYFVTLESSRGDRTIWGLDLERAFKESLTKPEVGDDVGLRTVSQDPVKVRTQKRGDTGELAEGEIETHRNRWIIEKRAFFEARAEAARTVRDTSVDPKQAVKQHPELVGTYLQVRAAELAAKLMRDPQDRALFLAKVRSALAEGIARGEPLPAVRLRESVAERAPRAPDREAAPVRS
jgi:putative DNA primase/helicase